MLAGRLMQINPADLIYMSGGVSKTGRPKSSAPRSKDQRSIFLKMLVAALGLPGSTLREPIPTV
jgi:hypothetical protein